MREMPLHTCRDCRGDRPFPPIHPQIRLRAADHRQQALHQSAPLSQGVRQPGGEPGVLLPRQFRVFQEAQEPPLLSQDCQGSGYRRYAPLYQALIHQSEPQRQQPPHHAARGGRGVCLSWSRGIQAGGGTRSMLHPDVQALQAESHTSPREPDHHNRFA